MRQRHSRDFFGAGFAGLMLAMAATAQAEGPARFESVIKLAGVAAGSYTEETARAENRFSDSVVEMMVLNRLGALVTMKASDTFYQDPQGNLLGGHFEQSSSKDSIATDLVVRGQDLELTNSAGGKAYSRHQSFTGTLIGPEGVRRLMKQARDGAGPMSYQTFLSATGAVVKATLTYQGSDEVNVEGKAVPAFRYLESVEGLPDSATVWVDDAGYTLKLSAKTPFGPMEITRGAPAADVLAKGADLPAEVYERTIAVNNITLPHPRRLNSVRLVIVKKPDAEDGWPELASPTQHVIEETPRRVVLDIAKPGADADRTPPSEAELRADALIQSDDADVARLAAQITRGETDPWKAALKIQGWTSRNMNFDPGIAVAPASELVKDRHGTCLGYSILFAALARASHIPVRIRMGYVYTGRMWGGHAWDEVYARGVWRPLDATLYYPGVADAARIGASVETGEGGFLTGVGALEKLYGKIDVSVLAYQGMGARTHVAPDAADHSIRGDQYRNPWLGLKVIKPAGTAFTNLDGHWPSAVVLAMEGSEGSAALRLSPASPDRPLAEQVRGTLKWLPDFKDSALQSTLWNGRPAVRFQGQGGVGIATRRDDELWWLTVSGAGAQALLRDVLPGVALN